jgi:hypothetical protein
MHQSARVQCIRGAASEATTNHVKTQVKSFIKKKSKIHVYITKQNATTKRLMRWLENGMGLRARPNRKSFCKQKEEKKQKSTVRLLKERR